MNRVVLGDDQLMLDYYRRQVIGGPGAFAISTGEAATPVEALTRKFLYDIVVAARGPVATDRMSDLGEEAMPEPSF